MRSNSAGGEGRACRRERGATPRRVWIPRPARQRGGFVDLAPHHVAALRSPVSCRCSRRGRRTLVQFEPFVAGIRASSVDGEDLAMSAMHGDRAFRLAGARSNGDPFVGRSRLVLLFQAAVDGADLLPQLSTAERDRRAILGVHQDR
jgi:hypothetical protein